MLQVKNSNVWDLADLSKYLYFNCPEELCPFKSQDKYLFEDHMREFNSIDCIVPGFVVQVQLSSFLESISDNSLLRIFSIF